MVCQHNLAQEIFAGEQFDLRVHLLLCNLRARDLNLARGLIAADDWINAFTLDEKFHLRVIAGQDQCRQHSAEKYAEETERRHTAMPEKYDRHFARGVGPQFVVLRAQYNGV